MKILEYWKRKYLKILVQWKRTCLTVLELLEKSKTVLLGQQKLSNAKKMGRKLHDIKTTNDGEFRQMQNMEKKSNILEEHLIGTTNP